MQNPINVKVDLEANAAYVRYQPSSGGERFARNERLSQDVVIDFDADSQVLGIQVLAFDEEAIGVARLGRRSRRGMIAAPIETRRNI